ncbi:MAG: hypothetical protein H6690_03135 [Erysipelotrichaceae bacterium]|nr:hypothetical protein [Erysipelotrichaceae bacterium]
MKKKRYLLGILLLVPMSISFISCANSELVITPKEDKIYYAGDFFDLDDFNIKNGSDNLKIELDGEEFENGSVLNEKGNYIFTITNEDNQKSTSLSLDVLAKQDRNISKENFTYYDLGKNASLPTLQTTGDLNILVVPYKVKGFEKNATESNLERIKRTFTGDSTNTNYESVSSFYKKSSYGKLNLNFTVTDWFDTKMSPFVGKEFVGDYSGSLLNMVEDLYYDPEYSYGDQYNVEKEYLRIDNSGLYAYKTSSSGLSSLGTTVLTLADDNKTLTAGTDKFIYQDGWVLKVGDDIASSALMKLGETGETSALSYAKVDGDAKKAVVKETIGGTAYYAYVDLTDNTFKVGLTAEVVSGSEFKSDGIITLKDSTNTAYKTFKFSSSSACSSVVSDGIGGTYTAKASTTDYGNLILDGFGSAKFSSFSYSAYTYTVKDVNVGTESEPIMEKQLTLVGCDGSPSSNPSITRVLVLDGTNYTVKGSTKLDASTAISFASGDLAVGAKTYRLTVKFDEKNFYCTSALKAEDGTYGSEVEMLRFASCSFAEDLTGEDTLITLDTEYGFGGSTASSLVIKYHPAVGETAAYITMNGSIEDFNDSSIAFSLTDAILK